ncbi:MAG: ribose-phosphate diphosphokinase [Sphingomonadaceae bacterium]
MEIRLFSGSANPGLATTVAHELGIPLGKMLLRRFPDGEVEFRLEETVRGRDVYLLQPTGPPVNEHLMELLVMIDACRRASAGRVTAMISYYGYSRQEKKSRGREPITARLVADLLTVAGTDRVVSIDLHSPAIQGFFDIGMDHLTAVPLLIEHLRRHREPDMVVVSPDTGRVKLAESYARALGLPMVVLHKQRLGGAETEIHAVVGDVQGRRPIIIDDMITTGSTIQSAVRALLAAGATPEVSVSVTHGLLVGEAVERLAEPSIAEVTLTDTVPIPREKRLPKMHVVSVAGLLAEAVRRLNEDRSISEIFPPRYDHHPV